MKFTIAMIDRAPVLSDRFINPIKCFTKTIKLILINNKIKIIKNFHYFLSYKNFPHFRKKFPRFEKKASALFPQKFSAANFRVIHFLFPHFSAKKIRVLETAN